MARNAQLSLIGALGSLALMMLSAGAQAQAHTVGLECIEDFSACSGDSNLPNACDVVDNAFGLGGTVSYRWANNDVWESDFLDEALGGEDHLWADNVDVLYFSGHGTAGGTDNWLGLRTPGSGCGFAESGGPNEMRFGRRAQLVLLDASCTGVVAERERVWYGNDASGMLAMGAKQGFAFMNSPADTTHRGWKFSVLQGWGRTNEAAWLEAGTECISGACDDESPIVFTKGNSGTNAATRAHAMNIYNFLGYTTPSGGWHWHSIDNGSCS